MLGNVHGNVLVHHAGEHLFAGATIRESVLRHGLAHGLEQLLHEHAFQLLRHCAKLFILRRGSLRRVRGKPTRYVRHRLTTSAEMEPARRSASKIMATCDGGVCTACNAVINCCTEVPAASRTRPLAFPLVVSAGAPP